MTKPAMQRADMLLAAQHPDQTPFDYIVIGSGAGGGPLAARLARSGKRVLLLEAGHDPAVKNASRGDPVNPKAFEQWNWREVYAVPGYHAAATEDPQMSWHFSVRHYAKNRQQKKDSKYRYRKDPSSGGGNHKGGILYPRCSALGGCTAHNAMIMVRPNDYDWDRIALMTGDKGWRAERMQGYFARIENCMYQGVYRGFVRRALLHFGDAWLRLMQFINPRSQLDRSGHGFSGWQKTSFVSPSLLTHIARADRTFRDLLFTVVRELLSDRNLAWWWWKAVFHLELSKALDANDLQKRRQSPVGLNLVPIGTDGTRRSGVREWLLETAQKCPGHLVIETGAFAERILFTLAKAPPRANGVKIAQKSPLYMTGANAQPSQQCCNYFARQEIIVCGGAFNTPQLLMLSGIGNAATLAQHGVGGIYGANGGGKPFRVGDVVNLPGVGKNLQDRYEIGVVSEIKEALPCLTDATFQPGGGGADPVAAEWRRTGDGLYSTNGGALAILLDSGVSPNLREGDSSVPDLLIVGFPAAFRGYYWGWSKELFKAKMGAQDEQRNLWSWVILKGYTSNAGGSVRLRSSNPYEQPEINFHSFEESKGDAEGDLKALMHAIQYVRRINAAERSPFRKELQPGAKLEHESGALKRWIRKEAWGHHACGTCRIGSQRWQARAGDVTDNAVVDSRFQVHGVRGLRVVDASVFPQIPGYFICAAIFMIAEKAADDIVADCPEYPLELERREADAVRKRRAEAKPRNAAGKTAGTARDSTADDRLPSCTVGLALSGGGIRSGTFTLGVLQALAERDKLRSIDFLSSVSGGGFSGGFVGRLFVRLMQGAGTAVRDKVGRVQQVLKETNSAEMWWLRRHANYILAGGRPEVHIDLGIFWRNLMALHFTIAMLFLGLFGALRLIADRLWHGTVVMDVCKMGISPWWPLLIAVVVFGLVGPLSLSFWLTPQSDTKRRYPVSTTAGWIVLLASAVYALKQPAAALWAGGVIAMLLFAWLAQEVARWGVASNSPLEPLAKSVVVRNRMSLFLGRSVRLLFLAAAWVLLDTWARYTAANGWGHVVAAATAVFTTAMPLVSTLFTRLTSVSKAADSTKPDSRLALAAIAIGAYALLLALLFALDTTAHWVFEHGTSIGVLLTAASVSFSVAVARAFDILNRSSLQSAYGERIARAFLGAANEERTHRTASDASSDIVIADPQDDLPMDMYHPERAGGPLHLVNVCVNETADAVSGRRLAEDRGLPMCVGPEGVSVGLRYHAMWDKPVQAGKNWVRRLLDGLKAPVNAETRNVALRALPVDSDPQAFHVLGRRDGRLAEVESLRLSQWLGISAAALTTGMGRMTRRPISLLLGLLNLRLGYWWDSSIRADHRSDRYPPTFLQRILSFPGWLFQVQSRLLNEWRGYFAGPSDRYWYLTDGGHFENLGLYELLRRRLPFMIAVDATEDRKYKFENLAIVTRQARIDFGATFIWIEPLTKPRPGKANWNAFEKGGKVAIPGWIKAWLNPAAIGGLREITRNGPHCAALARITYDGMPDVESWLLFMKPVVSPEAPFDVRHYAEQNKAFPNDPTFNPFFKDDQWESYRALGQLLGRQIFT